MHVAQHQSLLFKKWFICSILVLSFPSVLKAQDNSYLTYYASKVDSILGIMTLDEKIGQMTQVERSKISGAEVKAYYIGSLLSGGGSHPSGNTVNAWGDMYNNFQNYALETRLGIPLIYGVDAVHGHNNVYGATIFPHNIGLGCTRNAELVKKCSEITAYEVMATGINWTFSPCIAVARDERWGRTYESFSEDPILVAQLGKAAVEGYQMANDTTINGILACAKHFIGDGGTSGGQDQGNTRINEATLREIHLPGYIDAINAGVGSVMASFSSWNGVPSHKSKYLLTELLKEELGFQGFVISDWAGIGNANHENYKNDVQLAINAGIDMVMVPDNFKNFIRVTKELVNEEKISQQRIDDAVRRILLQKFRLGLFENPFTNKKLIPLVGSGDHRNVARQAVRESLVLLKNENQVLPLKKDGMHIHVLGKAADDIGIQCGGWTISWQGSTGNITSGTTIYEGFKKAVNGSTVTHNVSGPIPDNTEVCVVVAGENPYAEGKGDDNDLALSASDALLIKEAKNKGIPVVVLLISGRPLIIDNIMDYADAVVAAWLPGTEGDGIADVLFGDFLPKGKLSFTWPASMSQIPVNIGDNEYSPMFEYGYGLQDWDSEKTSNEIFLNPKSITIYPNPASDFVMISSEETILKIEIYDLNGRMQKLILDADDHLNLIPLKELSAGIYIISAHLIDGTVAKKKLIVSAGFSCRYSR